MVKITLNKSPDRGSLRRHEADKEGGVPRASETKGGGEEANSALCWFLQSAICFGKHARHRGQHALSFNQRGKRLASVH